MKAIDISAFGPAENLRLVEVKNPTIQDDDQILIRVKAAGVNRPDIVQREGKYPAPLGASPLPGLEVAGVVEAIGNQVTQFKIGDKICALLEGGGYAEKALASEKCCLPVPHNLSYEEASALPETFFTVWSNLFMNNDIWEGKKLLIHGGSSGIGSTAIQLAKAFGLTVFATAGSKDKCDFCKSLGADNVINYKEKDFVQEILSATNNNGVDIILDMVGGSYIPRNIKCLATGGRHITIAFQESPKAELNLIPILLKRLTLTGSTLRPRSKNFKGKIASELREKVWPLLERGIIKPTIYETFPLENAASAHKLMESGKHMGKIILKT